MILWAKIGISFVVGAAAAAFASPETAPRDVSAAYVDCEGCDPTGGIRVYTYRTAGTPPTGVGARITGALTQAADKGFSRPRNEPCQARSPEFIPSTRRSIAWATGRTTTERWSNAAASRSGCRRMRSRGGVPSLLGVVEGSANTRTWRSRRRSRYVCCSSCHCAKWKDSCVRCSI